MRIVGETYRLSPCRGPPSLLKFGFSKFQKWRRRYVVWKKERSISITIVEDKYSVDESGRLIIPVEAIHEMGLDIGDDVFASFISNGQEANVYRELLIASASLQELDSAPKSITIPDELMENAGIMPDADIQIICGQGVILITAQASMSTSELREVPQSLYLQYFI